MKSFASTIALGLLFCSACHPSVAGKTVPPPEGGLRSNHNYILGDTDCTPLRNVKITVDITEGLASSAGLGFQLNAYSLSKNPPSKIDWQQYMVGISIENGKPVVHASTENWEKAGLLNRGGHDLWKLSEDKLPARSKITIALHTDDRGNVVAADYTVVEPDGTAHEFLQKVSDLEKFEPGDMAPIVAFELNLVGPSGNVLSSGKGSIEYEAATPMTVTTKEPSCVDSHTYTAETTNSVYTELPPGPSTRFKQMFEAKVGP